MINHMRARELVSQTRRNTCKSRVISIVYRTLFTYWRHDWVCDEDLALRDDDLRGVDERARLSYLQDLHARQSLLRTPADDDDGW